MNFKCSFNFLFYFILSHSLSFLYVRTCSRKKVWWNFQMKMYWLMAFWQINLHLNLTLYFFALLIRKDILKISGIELSTHETNGFEALATHLVVWKKKRSTQSIILFMQLCEYWSKYEQQISFLTFGQKSGKLDDFKWIYVYRNSGCQEILTSDPDAMLPTILPVH